ncbi:MAG: PfkB family carbohydrate kinase, partial [Anaerolineae bacterium]|nr:PfkB family carbohydrate kinase [Anaerolineae bacterium]
AAPTLIKPNIDELQELVDSHLKTNVDVIQAAQQWLDNGIQTVVVSMGAEGALFVESNEAVLAQPPRVTVKSTVGAGDAMVSGTVAGKTKGATLADCARLATAFSLSAVTNVGSGLPSLEAIETFKSQITVKNLEPIK